MKLFRELIFVIVATVYIVTVALAYNMGYNDGQKDATRNERLQDTYYLKI